MPPRVTVPLWSLGVLAAALLACDYGHDGPRPQDDGAGGTGGATVIEEGRIDADATLVDVEPGQGAGFFIEYEAGGTWRFRAACDTAISGYACLWDVIVSPVESPALLGFSTDALDASDSLLWEAGGVRMIASTGMEIDSFTVSAPPGEALRFDVYLDDQPAPRFVYWVGDGALNAGAPSNPVDLVPSAP
ncbi:MAG: hypothetical protein IT376_19660 [Polyangiaceae bacterium]|nr:hypothetical protein [Polyangiaceae bacterium]